MAPSQLCFIRFRLSAGSDWRKLLALRRGAGR